MKLMKMMLVMLSMTLVMGCSVNGGGSVDRAFFANSSLNAGSATVTRESGDKLVFRYELKYPEDSKVADDGLTEVFWFEVPDGTTSFDFSMEGGATIPVAYQRICFCDEQTYTITSGFISGGKVNEGEWKIAFQLRAQDGSNLVYPLQDEGSYIIRN